MTGLRQLLTAPNQLTLLRLLFVPWVIVEISDRDWGVALAIFLAAGVTDGLDGLLARVLRQRTTLGQYLDPIADKLLLSTLFITLSIAHKIPWRVTVMVFTRDAFIVIVAGVLYIAAGLRDFRPSIFGKANTVAQIVTVGAVLLYEIYPVTWVNYLRLGALWCAFAFTIISGVHYALRAGAKLRNSDARAAVQRAR
jgi:cardiolipin synthase